MKGRPTQHNIEPLLMIGWLQPSKFPEADIDGVHHGVKGSDRRPVQLGCCCVFVQQDGERVLSVCVDRSEVIARSFIRQRETATALARVGTTR